jgi:uncharacterized protein
MALEMRENCENCIKELHKNSLAYICTHECTFCHECTESKNYVCPNCRGELVKRPRSGEISSSCPIDS